MEEITDSNQPAIYQIRLEGQLGPDWTDWFGGLSLSLAENGDTLLTGLVIDQAALHGLLKKVRDLGMPLISVNPLPFSEPQLENDEPNISSDQEEKIK
ncbi:MAG TPA: hypothetical protein VFY25_01585 [Anaerolineales bacterium]|nr:hypothetical protein [Anaerolineales bacterium]